MTSEDGFSRADNSASSNDSHKQPLETYSYTTADQSIKDTQAFAAMPITNMDVTIKCAKL